MHRLRPLLLLLSVLASCHKGPKWHREARIPNASFHAVWGSARDDVWLGGLGALLHWDGKELRPVKLETREPLNEVSSIWGAARDDVWISTGSADTLRHFDGQRWSAIGPPLPRGGGTLWGFARDDVWSCCTASDGAGSWNGASHWNGTNWTPVPIGLGGGLELGHVWGARSHDLWLAGQGGLVVHGDGERWKVVPSGVKKDIHAIWGSGSADVWFAGGDGVLLHWDGGSLAPVPSGSTENIAALWGTGPADVWAFGGGGDPLGSAAPMRHWDGTRWTLIPGPEVLMAAWGAGPGDIWAAGYDGLVEHFY
jgi:hypothetical protein